MSNYKKDLDAIDEFIDSWAIKNIDVVVKIEKTSDSPVGYVAYLRDINFGPIVYSETEKEVKILILKQLKQFNAIMLALDISKDYDDKSDKTAAKASIAAKVGAFPIDREIKFETAYAGR